MTKHKPDKVLLLAAGEGQRMRPLTEKTPKPLLNVRGKALIVHHIEQLQRQGFYDLVINVRYLKQQVMDVLGDGSRWDVHIEYSQESENLEVAGGIVQALPLLGNAPFLMVSADIWCPFDFSTLHLANDKLAHMVMVENPHDHQAGDFYWDPQNHSLSLSQKSDSNNRTQTHQQSMTYGNIGVYSPQLFEGFSQGFRRFGPVMTQAIAADKVTGQALKNTPWFNVGTPEALAACEQYALSLTNE